MFISRGPSVEHTRTTLTRIPNPTYTCLFSSTYPCLFPCRFAHICARSALMVVVIISLGYFSSTRFTTHLRELVTSTGRTRGHRSQTMHRRGKKHTQKNNPVDTRRGHKQDRSHLSQQSANHLPHPSSTAHTLSARDPDEGRGKCVGASASLSPSLHPYQHRRDFIPMNTGVLPAHTSSSAGGERQRVAYRLVDVTDQ